MFHTKAVMLLVLTTGFLRPAAAQCVVNKAAFVAKVSWFKPGTVASRMDGGKLTFDASGGPYKEDKSVPVGGKSCGNAGDIAIASVVAGKMANLAVGVGIGVAGTAAGVGICLGTVGTLCKVGAAVAGVSWKVGKMTYDSMPDPEEIFFIGALPSDIIVRGNVWEAQVLYANEVDFERDCKGHNKGYTCYNGNTRGTCTINDSGIARCMDGPCDQKCQEAHERKCTKFNEGFACYDGNSPGKCSWNAGVANCKKN